MPHFPKSLRVSDYISALLGWFMLCYCDDTLIQNYYMRLIVNLSIIQEAKQRHFSQQKCLFAEKKAEIEKLAEEYVVTVKNLASEQRVEHLQKIQNAYSKCKEFSDDKVQLAMQTYEMVSAEFFTNICSKVKVIHNTCLICRWTNISADWMQILRALRTS